MAWKDNFGRLNYGTGLSRPETRSMPGIPPMPPPPAYNEGIQTLVNTYVPPTDIYTQAADQRVRAGQTNVAAQNLANQQAATYADMFTPRTTADTTTEDTSGVNTGGDDTSGIDPSVTDTTGTGSTTSADGGVTIGGVGTTTNTGLTTQDLIEDYLQSQGISMDSLNNPAIDYYNIGNAGFIPGAFDPFSNTPFFTPANTVNIPSGVPRETLPRGFAPIGIETLSNNPFTFGGK